MTSLAVASLLEGEDPTTCDARDARHWASIYDQLILFKRRLISKAQSEMEVLAERARAEAGTDVAMLSAQLHRYEERLDFWYSRQWELSGIDIDDDLRTVSHRGTTVRLTRRELQLLRQLLTHPGHVFTARQLVREAWDKADLTQEQLRMYVGRLRRKLALLGLATIVNHPGQGYALVFTEPL